MASRNACCSFLGLRCLFNLDRTIFSNSFDSKVRREMGLKLFGIRWSFFGLGIMIMIVFSRTSKSTNF